jgi:glycosyltransferase involved in cell wall biosynthesis
MSNQRVAIQLTSTGGFYGAERTLVELAAYLRDQGWDSHVVALEGAGAVEVVRRATAERLTAKAFVTSGRLGLIPMVQHLRSLLQRHPRAVVHSHGYKPDILLSWLRVPHRLICLATCHSWYSMSLKHRILEALDKRAVRGFDHVIAVSDEIARDLTDNGVPTRKVSLINNGIRVPRPGPDARARIRAEMGVAAGSRVIVQIGRLAQSKRNDLLLDAVAALPQPLAPHVWLIGEGDRKPMLMDSVREHGLHDRVRFCGYRTDIPEIMTAADALAVTSDKEGLPITILEAMATHCPVISTNVGDIPHVLKDGRDAWLVPAGDRAALARALAEALGQPELARARAESAYREYCHAYSRDSMGSRYLEIYEAAWARRGWRADSES